MNAYKNALAATLTMAIAYGLCTLMALYWPEKCLQLTADILHLSDLNQFASDIIVTPQNFASGIAQLMAYTYAFVWCWSQIYQVLLKK